MQKMMTGILCFSAYWMLSLAMPQLGRSADAVEVKVNNFPRSQTVNGSVSLEGTTKAAKVEEILVPPSRRADLSEMLQVGKVDTDNYTSVSLFLQGEIKSTTVAAGSIGVVLVPDEEAVLRVLKDAKKIQFPLETICTIKSGDSEYFSCESIQTIAFPRYRMYLYNTSSKSAEVNVYLYLRK